jgi:hypothetical protein
VGAGGALGSGAGCPYLLASHRLRGSPDRAFSYLVLTRNMSRAFPRSSQTNRLCRQKLDPEPPSHVPYSTGLSHIPLRSNADEPKRWTAGTWGQRDACATLLLLRPRTHCGSRVVGCSCHASRPRASAPTRAEPSTNVGALPWKSGRQPGLKTVELGGSLRISFIYGDHSLFATSRPANTEHCLTIGLPVLIYRPLITRDAQRKLKLSAFAAKRV